MDKVAATGSAADFFIDPAGPVARDKARGGSGVVARGMREQRLAALLREAAEWAREEGARICEVSSVANTGVRELRTLLASLGPPSVL
jgi:hypothetical protein